MVGAHTYTHVPWCNEHSACEDAKTYSPTQVFAHAMHLTPLHVVGEARTKVRRVLFRGSAAADTLLLLLLLRRRRRFACMRHTPANQQQRHDTVTSQMRRRRESVRTRPCKIETLQHGQSVPVGKTRNTNTRKRTCRCGAVRADAGLAAPALALAALLVFGKHTHNDRGADGR